MSCGISQSSIGCLTKIKVLAESLVKAWLLTVSYRKRMADPLGLFVRESHLDPRPLLHHLNPSPKAPYPNNLMFPCIKFGEMWYPDHTSTCLHRKIHPKTMCRRLRGTSPASHWDPCSPLPPSKHSSCPCLLRPCVSKDTNRGAGGSQQGQATPAP